METEIALKMLAVGDKVYKTSYGAVQEILTIDKVTPAQAHCGHLKFRRSVETRGYVKEIGGWDSYCSYYIETEELKEKYFRQAAPKKILSYNYDKLPTEKIKAILEILFPTA